MADDPIEHDLDLQVVRAVEPYESFFRREFPKRRLAQSGVWLLGTGLVTAVVIFVASLFGLTGA